MAEKSWFFTEVGSAPTYGPNDFAQWLYNAMFRNDGVLKGLDNSLAVTSDGAGNALIATGCAMKTGHGYQNDAVLTKALTLPASGYANVNTLVARVDSAASPNTFHVYLLVGSSVANPGTPTPPAITAGTDVYLADILIRNTSGSYSYTVTDQRVFAKVQANGLLGANWEAALESAGPNGANWLAAIGAVLGSNMKQLMADDLGTLWEGALNTDLGAGWPTLFVGSAPNVFQGQRVTLTSGSGNWTVPAGVYQLRVICVGGGGGGGGGGGSGYINGGAGGAGGTTTFGSISATGGAGGGGGIGGSAGAGGGGGGGASHDSALTAGGVGCGSAGGSGWFGTAGGAGGVGGANGANGVTNSGAGGSGGAGGGSDLPYIAPTIVTVTPKQVISYSVGAGGSAGSAGTSANPGNAGAAGLIIIEY